MGPRNKRFDKPKKKTYVDGREVRLNLRRVEEFKYELRGVIDRSTTEDKFVQSFLATLVARASRESMQAAKDYVTEKCKEGMIDPEAEKQLLKILSRYSKYR